MYNIILNMLFCLRPSQLKCILSIIVVIIFTKDHIYASKSSGVNAAFYVFVLDGSSKHITSLFFT